VSFPPVPLRTQPSTSAFVLAAETASRSEQDVLEPPRSSALVVTLIRAPSAGATKTVIVSRTATPAIPLRIVMGRLDPIVADAKSFRIAVLASGSGTNLQAILDQLHGREGIEVVAVASDKPGARALDRATDAGIPAEVFPAEGHDHREARDSAIGDWLDSIGVDLVVLAGYMQLLSPGFVERFPNRIVNVHPALLPSFPGLDAIGQALAHGVKITGITIHFVDAGVDSGPIIVQRPVSVPPDGDRDALEATIHATEHELYPEAIRMIAAGRVSVEGRVVRISEPD
jgi:phosphoribosylglycinamide formyltransferase 1